jgi:signal transduction histidine kinase
MTPPRTIPLRWFGVGVVAPLLVLPLLVAAATWQIIGDRQQADAERRLESAESFVRAGADRSGDPDWQARLTTRLSELRVSGTVYEIGSFGKRPIYLDQLEAAPEDLKLVPLATTANGTLAATLFPDPPDRSVRVAWALSGGLGALAAGLVVVFWLFDRWLIRPLRAFSDAVDSIAGGDPPKRLPRSPLREVGNVSEALAGMNATLRTAAVREETMDRERRLLISAIAHDLRTPLFTLRGYLQALQQGLGNGDHLAGAEAKAAQLERLIDDLFAFTRLEYLGEQPDAGRVILGDLLRHAAAAFEPLATRKRISVRVEGDDAVSVLADGHHLERVVANLLDNALTHTPNGGLIGVRWGRDGATAWFRIADSGAGIPESALPHVFEPLFRADRSRAGATGGAGLGLTIAQRLLHANGGQLTARNDRAGGAVLTATLPALVQPRIHAGSVSRNG